MEQAVEEVRCCVEQAFHKSDWLNLDGAGLQACIKAIELHRL
jgi:hypothetical protein